MSTNGNKIGDGIVSFCLFSIDCPSVTGDINTSVALIFSLEWVIVKLWIERVFYKKSDTFFKTFTDPDINFLEFL